MRLIIQSIKKYRSRIRSKNVQFKTFRLSTKKYTKEMADSLKSFHSIDLVDTIKSKL